MTPILLAEDKDSLGRMLVEALSAEGFEVDLAGSGTEAIRRIREGKRYAAVLTDLRLPGADGIAVLSESKEVDPTCPVIVMTAFGTIENAVAAMKLGAWDFIQKPLDIDHLLLLLRRAIDHRRLRFENLLLRDEFEKRHGFPAIIGDSPAMRAISGQIEKVAATDSTVLLLGESGTGKELFARAVHQLSPRRDGPFIAINCAAIPDTLIENEFFGHEKGSYTGAVSRQMGKFELAESGTIFLDEIAELGLGMQTKILRVLQEKKFERIGGVTTLSANVRIVCATNRDLDEEVRQGRFREDLFFRINVFPITVPPLRARRGDIDALVDHFLRRIGSEIGRTGVGITAEARQLLRDHDWPGNVRELENCIERGVILCEGNTIEPRDLIIGPRRDDPRSSIESAMDLSGTLAEATARAVSLVERSRITAALAAAGSRAEAAESLGIGYRTLLGKMKELDIKDDG